MLRRRLVTRRLGCGRREKIYQGQRMLAMVPPEKRRRDRPQRWYMDNTREDMRELGAKETDTQDRGR